MMNRAAFEAVLFLSFLAFTGCWACQTDSDCNDIHSPVCNTEHNYCEQRTCTNETDCGPLYYCIIYSDDPITGLPTGYCYLKSCMNDTECGDGVSMSCRYGTCNCRQGFRFDGTDCVSSLGLDCNYDYECSSFYDTATYVWGTKYVCLEGVCSCNEAMWAPDLDECVPYYGLPCAVDAECGHKSNTTCNLATGFCDCQAGYTARDGICVWALEATCTQPNDCPTPFECRNDTCSCPEGMAIKSLNDPTCAQVLDSSCRDIHMCADPDDHEYIKSYFFGMYQSDSSLWFAKRAYYCNVENMCKCAPGYMRSPSGLGCQPIYASECTTSSNCVGDSDVLSKAYDCVGGKCSCNAQHQFISVHDKYMHYGTARTSYDSPLEYICQPMIGMSCMYESYAHPDADCREYIGYNNYGSGYTYLTCYRGVEEHGNCSNILGSDCTEYRDVCNLVDNAKCSIDATCECKEGFYTPDWETDMCYGVLQTYYCENDSNCTDILPNTECVAGMCSCLNGYTEMNNVCIDDAELDAPCNAAVPDMPDIYRRSPSYRLSPREDPVKDDQLIGGWYNIGPYLPTRGTEAPDKGSCGTIHPVYLTDSISATELEDLNAGQEIAKAVTVGGLGDYGQVSAEEIRLRKCDNDYHAFLPSTPIAFSAYCIDTFRHSHAEGNSSELSVGVKQDLSFRTVFDAELGYDFYEPYLTFKCKVSWKKDSNDQSECPGCFLNSNLNDGLFYTIIWYVNGKFVKLQGPFLRSQLSQANITEEAIVNTTGESPSGYKVQCSVEWSETLAGKRSTPTFSSATFVGFYSWVVNASSAGAFAVTLQTTTPIGCRTPVHENFNEYCQIWVPLAEDGICPFQPSPDDHHLCGLNVTGFTQYKIQMHGQFDEYMLDSPHRQYDYDLNSYFYVDRTYGLKVLISQEEHERTNVLKASFGNLSSGHFIWDGIRIPDLKVHVEIEDDANLRSVLRTWNYMNSQPEIVKNSEGHVNTSLPVKAIGEFRILRSTIYPVEIQMKTEACPEDNTRVCVCAITFRNVNEIYTVDICDSFSREGFLYVGPEEDASHDIFYLGYFGTYLSYFNKNIVLRNGLILTTTRNYVTGSLEVVIYDGGTLEAFTEMEGIAAFQSGKYRLGDGSYVLDSNGFMESWRVDPSESLLNPDNHKNFGFTDDFYQCHCPTSNELVDNFESNLINDYGYQFYINSHYSSVIKCSLETACSSSHGGEEWSGALLPPIMSVMDISVNPDLDAINCSFTPVDGKAHHVQWFNGDTLLHDYEVTTSVGIYRLDITSTLFEHSGDICDFNNLWCAVGVYDVDLSTPLGPTTYGGPFSLSKDYTKELLHFCMIDGRCYAENVTHPDDPTHACYPSIDPNRWMKDPALQKYPGDLCVYGGTECDLVEGGAFCDNTTNRCACYPMDTVNVNGTGCEGISCSYYGECMNYGLMNAECIDFVCACPSWTYPDPAMYGCSQKLVGSECTSDYDCSHIHGGYCDNTTTDMEPSRCACFDMYIPKDGYCQMRGINDPCGTDDDCSSVQNSACYKQGDGQVCQCRFGYFADPSMGICMVSADVIRPHEESIWEYCSSDTNCSTNLWYTSCDKINYLSCVKRNCDSYAMDGSYTCNSSLLYCAQDTLKCEPYLCSTSDQRDCKQGTECNFDKGYCDCPDGFSMLDGECSAVFDRECSDNSQCSSKNGRYVCQDQHCACDPSLWVEEDGLCKSPASMPCTTPACGAETNTTCFEGICDCMPGYILSENACVLVIHARCSVASDCPTEFCRNSSCSCPEGHAWVPKSLTCQKVLDSYCKDIPVCADPFTEDYRRIYTESWVINDPYHWGFKRAYYCNVENICSCAPGYKRTANELGCTPIHGANCTSNSDCSGDSDVYSKAFTCNVGTCECNEQHKQTSVLDQHSMYYSVYPEDYYTAQNEFICRPYVGMDCMTTGYYTQVPDATCMPYTGNSYYIGTYDVATCNSGFEEHGNCIWLLGADCTEYEETCELIENARCSIDKICTCKDGYFTPEWDPNNCHKVLNHPDFVCDHDTNCTDFTSGSLCVSSVCLCAEDFTEHNGICAPSGVIGIACYDQFSVIPDLFRRSPGYKLSQSEMSVQDNGLKEGWYNIGSYLPATLAGVIERGMCGSFYPVYMTEELTSDDYDILNDNMEVTKNVVIGGLEPYDAVATYPIRLRKCGDDYHVYLTATPIPFSAYCIETNRPYHIGGNISDIAVTVQQSLEFTTELETSGTIIYEPKLVFICNIPRSDDPYGFYSQCIGCYPDYNINNGFFYTISWYVNGEQIKRSGPFSRMNLYQSKLYENDVLERYGQFQSGDEVRCSFEWSETLFGMRSTPTFSAPSLVGFYSWVVNASSEGAFAVTLLSQTPIGCSTPDYATDEYCSIWVNLAQDGVCPFQLSTDDHHLCGVNITGFTNYKLQMHGGYWPSMLSELHQRYEFSYFADYTYETYIDTTYGVKIIVSDEMHERTNLFKASFESLVTDHEILNGLHIPDLMVYVETKNLNLGRYFEIRWNYVSNSPEILKIDARNTTTSLDVNEIGEFLVLRSNLYPIEVQMKTEVCQPDSSTVCVCAVTFRNLNEIYTVDQCDSISREGFLYVGQEEDAQLDLFYSGVIYVEYLSSSSQSIILKNGLSLEISRNYDTSSLELVINDVGGFEEFTEMDGLAAFQNNQYRHGDGSFGTDSNGFINSWSVTLSESLRNPSNFKSYAYNDTFYQCHCPSSSELLNNHELSGDVDSYYDVPYMYDGIKRNYYSSALKCSLTTECTSSHTGDTWHTSSLTPSIQVDDLAYEFDTDTLICSFVPVENKKHSIKWFNGDTLIDSGIFDSSTTDSSPQRLNIRSTLFTTSGEECYISTVRCEVTVLDNDVQTPAGPTIYGRLFEYREEFPNEMLTFCMIDGLCYEANFTSPFEDTHACFPSVDPYRWMKDPLLERNPGDPCVLGQRQCDTVLGGGFCDEVTHLCQCYPTHTENENGTECYSKVCTSFDECISMYNILNAECINNECACPSWTEPDTAGCLPKVPGSECTTDFDCGHMIGSLCDNSTGPAQCVCGSQYKPVDGDCQLLGLNDPCNSNFDCLSVFNSACYGGEEGVDGMFCRCRYGYEDNGFGECNSTGQLVKPSDQYQYSTYCNENVECTDSLWYPSCDVYGMNVCSKKTCDPWSSDTGCNSSLLYCNQESHYCEPNLCSAENQRDCKGLFVECNVAKGYCDCIDGYSLENGECAPVLHRPCTYYSQCHSKNNRYTCVNEMCECDSTVWIEDNGLCISPAGMSCETPTCGPITNTTCKNDVCACMDGHVLSDGVCVTVLDQMCTTNGDCPSGMVCINATCSCPEGQSIRSAVDTTCTPVLDSSCRDIHACGNPSHNYYKQSYYNTWYLSDVYYSSFRRAYYCNMENICKCAPGYKRTPNNMGCKPIYGSNCTSTSECKGDSTVLSNAYTCDLYSGTCLCNERYSYISIWERYPQMISWDHNAFSYDEGVCQPYVGGDCSYNPVVLDDTVCTTFLGQSFTYDILSCTNGIGIEEHGSCTEILGSDCSSFEETCGLVNNATCSDQSKCACKPGFFASSPDSCMPVVNHAPCAANSDCLALAENTECTTAMCICASGFIENNGKCISEGSTPDFCDEEVRDIPDLYRRDPGYKTAKREVPIQDHKLPEAWYNLGPYLPSVNSGNIAKGDCGTFYPIYLTAEVSSSDHNSLEAGNQITKSAKVGGLEDYDFSSGVYIKLRKCGSNYLAYLTKAPVSYAGYCIDTLRLSHDGGNSTESTVYVSQSLTYEQKYNAAGIMEYIPQLSFACNVWNRFDVHNYLYTGSCDGCYQNVNRNDGFYYTIHWYINGTHVKGIGPYNRVSLYQADLTEEEIIDEFGQTTAGFDIQCSAQMSESLFGMRSTPTFSEKIYVGFFSWVVNASENGAFAVAWQSQSPIGCVSEEYTYDEHCSLWLGIEKEGECPLLKTTNEHYMCGVNVTGFTYNKIQNYGGNTYSDYPYMLHSTHMFYHNENNYDGIPETPDETYVTTVYGTKILMSDETHDSSSVYKASFGNLTSGHRLWNGYEMPDLKVFVSSNNFYPDRSFSILWDSLSNSAILRKTNERNLSTDIPLTTIGEFLVLRSNIYPVEVQLVTEERTTGIVVCSVTYRDVNEIFTYDECEARSRTGFLYVDDNEDGLQDLFYSGLVYPHELSSQTISLRNRIQLKVIKDWGSGSLLLHLSDVNSLEPFNEMDGLAAFQSMQFRLSDGVFNTESTGFVDSWRRTTSQSLQNPSNHKSFSYEDNFFKCHCPESEELSDTYEIAEDKIVNYTYNLWRQITRNHFNSALKCSKTTECTNSQSGDTWEPSTLPDIIKVDDIEFTFDASLIYCTFTPVKQKTHFVQWYAGDTIATEYSLDDGTGPYTFDFNDNLFTSSGEECHLDHLWCAVTVYDSAQPTPVGPTVFSEPFDLANDLPTSTDLGFCVIDGNCYFANDMNTEDNTTVCYPALDPYRWLKDLTLDRVPGDFCVPGENHCDSVTGGAYCDDVTKVCTCFETHTGVATECAAITCYDEYDSVCGQIANGECRNGACACKITAHVNRGNGACVGKVVGSNCNGDDECSSIEGSYCGTDHPNRCVCGELYHTIGEGCFPKGLGDTCVDDDGCSLVSNAGCYDQETGTNSLCECKFGYAENENRQCVSTGVITKPDPYNSQQWCYQDDDQCSASLWYTVCDDWYWQCVTRSCNASSEDGDASCMSKLLYCNAESGFCEPHLCSATDQRECKLDNSECDVDKGYCGCVDGYSIWNGDCSPVKDRACLDDTDCHSKKGRYVCSDNKCVCDSDKWVEDENGLCKSYVDQPCSSTTQCGKDSNTTCSDGQCECSAGFVLRDGACITVFLAGCNEDYDCSAMEGLECSSYAYYDDQFFGWNDPEYSGVCVCRPGYAPYARACKQVLGSQCDELKACGNASHWSYSYHYYSWGHYYAQYFKHYHSAFYCDVFDTCQCSRGYIKNADGTDCIALHDKGCTVDTDCGPLGNGYQCDISQCKCSQYFVEVSGRQNNNYYYWWYDSNGQSEYICTPQIGLSCNSYPCEVPGAFCDYSNSQAICSCEKGYEKSGQCTNYLGSYCTSDEVCSVVDHAHCNLEVEACTCINGFIEDHENDLCTPVLAQYCAGVVDCPMEGAVCDNNSCSCVTGTTEHNGQCFSNPDCAEDIPDLPDMRRRSSQYELSYNEPMINDDLLNAEWYNIGQNRISSAFITQSDVCGTKWPMFLTDSVPSLNDGESIETYFQIGGGSGITEQFPVTLRKCGMNNQIGLFDVPLAFSGFSLHHDVLSNPSKNSTGRWADIEQDLTYDSSDQPQIVFRCHALDTEHSYYPCSTCYDEFYFLNDGFYYTIHWYINDIECVTYGPLPRSDIRASNLLESVVMQECQQNVVGFDVQCSYEWSESVFGERSPPITSDKLTTGVKSRFLPVPSAGLLIEGVSETPIGCLDPYDLAFTCEVHWQLEGINCTGSTTPGADDHHLCGTTLIGLTITGLAHYSSWNGFIESYRSGYAYDATYGVMNTKAHKHIFEDGEYDLSDRFLEAYCPAATGHALWDGYTIPPTTISFDNSTDVGTFCQVTWNHQDNIPVLTKVKGDTSWEIPIDIVGEILLVRSLAYPMEVQIKTEVCSTSDNGVCVCAFTFRDGNRVYTVDTCSGVTREGFLWATYPDIPELSYTDSGLVRVLNGMEGMVDKNYTSKSLFANVSQVHSEEAFVDLDGICAFEDETFRRSTGGLMLNSEGFLNSWRVPVGDSLLEPNLSPTPYAYEEVLYDCGCPTSGDLIDTGETVNGTYGPVYVEFSGATKCSKASSRSVNHTGEVWTGTVIPDFAIENVTLTFAYQESQSKKMTRMAICEFEGQEGFTYTISWYADTLKLHENSLQSLTTTGHNTVSMETLTDAYNSLKASGSSCIINRKLRCAVSVHNLNEVEVLPDSFSEPFEIFTVPESHISIPRGAHTILDVIVNLPLLCEDGKPCHLEIKVVDEDDSYDCSDSTLAIKHMQTCGDIIDGIRDPSELNTFNGARELALTTIKNNKYSLKDAFSLTLMTSMSGSIDSFWDDCTIEQTVHVFIRDVERDYWKGNYCYVTSDPYFRTFDGVYYSNQQLGDSILYVNDRYKTMVQITTQECWPGSTRSCTCATTVRVGRDVYTVGHCNGTHLIEWISEDDDVLDVYYMPGYMNRFYLPYGTIVEVTYYVSEWWSTMNVFVFPSPNDMEESGGLCGTFNGDYMDDFLHRDGIKTPLESQNWWWWVWGGDPDAFAGSWQAHEEESLLNIDYVDTLESYSNGENFCVCPLINGERLPLCNPKEDRICIGDAYATRPGNQVAKQNGRQRRSLDMEDHNAVYDVHDIRQRLDDLKHMRTKRGTVRVRRQATGDPVAANESYYRALAECEAEMTDSCNSEAAGSLSSVAGSAPNNCAQDKMVSPNATAAVDIACAGMQAATKREVERNITALAESAEAVNIIINACPDNCSSNGVCINGTCICDEGYDQELSNCKLAINLPPEVQSHVENCNPKISTCCYIRFTTVSGCSSNITCKQQLRKFYANNTHADEEDTKAGVCDDGWTAYCPVECAGSSRRRREAGENTLMGTASNVSLSNDNSSFSAPELVTVLDTACLTYDATSNSITLASDYCLVDGVCYGNYTAFDDCSVCDPNVDQFDWTLLSDKCQIGGVCYPSGNVSTDNCLYGCQPSVDQYIWTERSEVCQIESECYMDGVNKSATEDCLYCNVTVDQFAWTKQNASCYIADVCHYNGDSKSADEYCMECRPDTNQFDWSQTSDTCHIGGSCYDNDNTSTDTCLFCNATMDPNQWTQTTNSCMIDRACYYENATSTQTCQTCLPSADQTSWTLTSGYCIIEDVCYQTNTLNPTDECRYCNSDMDSTTWQTNTSQECQQQQEESGGSSVGIIAGAVVATAVVVGGVAAGIFIYKYMKKQNSITARASAGLFDSAGNKHFKLRVDQDPSASKSTSSAPPMPYKLPKEVLPQGTMSAPVNLYTDATGDHPAPAPVGALPPIIGLGGGPAPALNLPPAE